MKACPNFNLTHNSRYITFPTHSCLVLYSFCTSFLHSLIIWLTVPSLSPHSLHLRFFSVLSIFAMTKLVLMAFIILCCLKRFNFSFQVIISSVQITSWGISLVCRLKYPYSCSFFILFSWFYCFTLCLLIISFNFTLIRYCNQSFFALFCLFLEYIPWIIPSIQSSVLSFFS